MLPHHLGYLYYTFETNIKLKSTIQANLALTPALSTLAATRYDLAEDMFEKSNTGYESSSISTSYPLPLRQVIPNRLHPKARVKAFRVQPSLQDNQNRLTAMLTAGRIAAQLLLVAG